MRKQNGAARAPSLQLGEGLELPVEAVTETFAILGKRGRGKTNTAVVLVEELLGAGLQVIVIDTVGAWWGLRSSADGTDAGLPVVILGGQHGDLPLPESSGAAVAGAVVEHRVSAVIDTSALSKAAARRWCTAFVTELYHRKGADRMPVHVVVDEADELAPQQHRGESAQLLGAMEDLVRRGRIRGIGCTLVTQRPASLNKDVLTQAEVLVALGMTGPRDVAAIDEWVRLHADEGEAREVKQTLAALPVGTAWVWSPEWLGVLRRVAIRRRRTFDSSATPKVGEVLLTPVPRPPLDLSVLAVLLADTSVRTDSGDEDLKRRLAAEQAAHAETRRQLQQREAELADAHRRLQEPTMPSWLEPELRRLLDRVRTVAQPVQHDVDERATLPPTSAAPAADVPAPVVPRRGAGAVDGRLPKAQRAVLTVLAQHGTQTVHQVALLAGYAANGGGFNNALSALRTAGRIIGPKTALQITCPGRAALGPVEPLPVGVELVDYWRGRVGKAERLILDALIEVWPGVLDRDALAAATGYASTGGGFNNALSRLRTLELISGDRMALLADAALGSPRR